MTSQHSTHVRSTTLNSDEDGEEAKFPFQKRKPYQHYEQTFTAQHIHFYLSEEIGEPHTYTDMIHRINVAGPNDVVFIHLNTPGGQLDTGVQLINAMNNSQARIVTVLDGMAYSLGTLIFLSGNEMIVNDNCMIMFHNFRSGLVGKGNELSSQLESTIKWFNTLAKKIYVPFMTDEEFASVVRGEDLWMQSTEIRKRLDRMSKLQEEGAKPAKQTRKKKAKAEVDETE